MKTSIFQKQLFCEIYLKGYINDVSLLNEKKKNCAFKR